MSDEDVVRYSDLSYVLEIIKKDDVCWQAAVSIGVHALSWGVWGKTDEERAENVVGRALEPFEALHQSLTRQAGQQPLTDEQGRMLFHVRFGLGFLLWVKGDHQRAKRVLHDMAATSLSWSRGWHRSGGGLTTYTDDIGAGKEVTALVMGLLCEEVQDYDEALYLIEQAADTPGHGSATLDLADDLLDRWAAKCEATERQRAADELDAFGEWSDLLHRAGQLLSVCQDADTSGALPGDCSSGSAQFLAYKLGEVAARFAVRNADTWRDYMEESDEPGGVDFLVEALLCDFEARPDWHKLRDRYLTGWRRTAVCEGMSPEEIGPHTDLYWATRIGFADKMLESAQALVPTVSPPGSLDLASRMQNIQHTVTATNLRLIRQQREQDERRPPTNQELRLFLEERLGRVWDNLPSDAMDALVSAEYSYRAGWQSSIPTRAVVEGFHDAVWACFQAYFVDRFIASLEKGGLPSSRLSYRGWRGEWQEREFKPDNPTSLSIGMWASVLEAVVDPEHTGTENLQVKEFVNRSWPSLDPGAAKELASSLRKVQHYRNHAVHRQWPPRSHHKESTDLEDIRKLVLDTDGDGSTSIIAQIYRLLAPSKQS